jgi:hypothetical protein
VRNGEGSETSLDDVQYADISSIVIILVQACQFFMQNNVMMGPFKHIAMPMSVFRRVARVASNAPACTS